MKSFNDAVRANQSTLDKVTNNITPGIAYTLQPKPIEVAPLPSLENFILQQQKVQAAAQALAEAEAEFEEFVSEFQKAMSEYAKQQLAIIRELAVAFRLENDPEYLAVFLYDTRKIRVKFNRLYIYLYNKEGERLDILELSPLILEGKTDAYRLGLSSVMLAKLQNVLDKAFKNYQDGPTW